MVHFKSAPAVRFVYQCSEAVGLTTLSLVMCLTPIALLPMQVLASEAQIPDHPDQISEADPGQALFSPKDQGQAGEALEAIAPAPVAQRPPDSPSDSQPPPESLESLDLPAEIIENSPVLQRWLQEIPDVLSDIHHDPAFRTRLRAGYSNVPSTADGSGFAVGVEDVFLGQTQLTLSGDYQQTWDGDRQAYGTDLRYYVRPLGRSVNVAPVVGYRRLETDAYTTDGVHLGVRVLLALSRSGAADIALTQSWVAPGTRNEVGLTSLSVGYAVTDHLRMAADLQQQNAPQDRDRRIGILLEWML